MTCHGPLRPIWPMPTPSVQNRDSINIMRLSLAAYTIFRSLSCISTPGISR
ncbi:MULTISPECIES: EspF repeat-containing protein [Limibacillus]|uniref:EspF repeat-containing protein n=1 Tax=Limibacillus TaxID=1848396 RepID=UPI00161A3A4A